MKTINLGESFYRLLLANLLSNCAVLYSLTGFRYVVFTLLISVLLTFIEYLVGEILPKKLRPVYYTCVILLYVLLIVVEYYIIIVFKYNITEDLLFILLDTNKGEIDGFFSAYAKPLPVIFFILSSFVIALGIYWGGKACMKLGGKRLLLPVIILSILGVGCYAYMGYSYVRMDDGMHATQYTTLTRILGASSKVRYRKNIIRSLRSVCQDVEVTEDGTDSINVVVVIGESFSRSHSSLYGYRLKTNPLLEKRRDDGELVVFSDVISRADATHEALRSVFSTDSLGLGFGEYPLFPAIFRKAGYKTYLWDNQYFVGNGISFMADKELSDILYDGRNETYSWTDGPFLDTMPDVGDCRKTLFVIHLVGQHFYYNDRYDESFRIFRPEDYSSDYTESQRETLADYDNATLYNDAILDRIMGMFSATETILIYFTDHGEELFENGDFSGHTNALRSKDLRYQIQSPFVIWLSSEYRTAHPDVYKRLLEVKDFPAMTDDVSHLLLDVAGLRTESFSPYRSIINPEYRQRDRMILNSFNYDEWMRARD